MSVQLAFKITTRLVTKRSHNKIMREINRETMEHIRDHYWPKHFQNVPETSPGGGGYGYAKRSAKYERYKFRKLGHNRPLVFSGALERSVRSGAKITSTPGRGTLRATSPHFLRVRNRQEIEAVSNREKQELAKLYGKRYVLRANSPAYQETRIRRPVAI